MNLAAAKVVVKKANGHIGGYDMDAKSYLKQIELYDIRINSKIEEVYKLKELATKVTSTLKADVVSGSMNQDKLGDAVGRIVDLQNDINESIDRYIDLREEIGKVFEKVTDSDEAAVLYKRYFLYKRWEQIACEMNMTYRNVCYIHGRALQTVESLLAQDTEACRI